MSEGIKTLLADDIISLIEELSDSGSVHDTEPSARFVYYKVNKMLDDFEKTHNISLENMNDT